MSNEVWKETMIEQRVNVRIQVKNSSLRAKKYGNVVR